MVTSSADCHTIFGFLLSTISQAIVHPFDLYRPCGLYCKLVLIVFNLWQKFLDGSHLKYIISEFVEVFFVFAFSLEFSPSMKTYKCSKCILLSVVHLVILGSKSKPKHGVTLSLTSLLTHLYLWPPCSLCQDLCLLFVLFFKELCF